MNHRERVISQAVKYAAHFGLAVLPLSSSKKPPSNYSWEPLQQRRMTVPEITSCPVWENVGIVTGEVSGVAVVDCDTMEAANQFWQKRPTPVVVQTPKGFHFFYRHPGQPVKTCQADGFDIRGDGGYVVAPPSVVAGKTYSFDRGADELFPEKLPLFDLNWIPQPKTETGSPAVDRRVKDGEAYISKIFAIEGQQAHNSTFRAVNRLKDSGMSELEAWMVLVRWNQTNCFGKDGRPYPWSDKELLHKLKSVY
ncbi:bifunctional DNA primase/polymerase [Gimesia sp.]|uniref:bifunctional DNA primase/polymerase n=1 Tax=Gimesia sp. TaxID=2024833 RepID=UPI0032EDD13C